MFFAEQRRKFQNMTNNFLFWDWRNVKKKLKKFIYIEARRKWARLRNTSFTDTLFKIKIFDTWITSNYFALWMLWEKTATKKNTKQVLNSDSISFLAFHYIPSLPSFLLRKIVYIMYFYCLFVRHLNFDESCEHNPEPFGRWPNQNPFHIYWKLIELVSYWFRLNEEPIWAITVF